MTIKSLFQNQLKRVLVLTACLTLFSSVISAQAEEENYPVPVTVTDDGIEECIMNPTPAMWTPGTITSPGSLFPGDSGLVQVSIDWLDGVDECGFPTAPTGTVVSNLSFNVEDPFTNVGSTCSGAGCPVGTNLIEGTFKVDEGALTGDYLGNFQITWTP